VCEGVGGVGGVGCVGCVGCVCGVCGGCGVRSTFNRLHLLRLWTPTIFIAPTNDSREESNNFSGV
jgi:hypothetical protein